VHYGNIEREERKVFQGARCKLFLCTHTRVPAVVGFLFWETGPFSGLLDFIAGKYNAERKDLLLQLVDKVRKSREILFFVTLLPVAPLCSREIRVKIFTAIIIPLKRETQRTYIAFII